MNLFSLLDQLSAVDASSDAAPRRHLLRQLGQAGAKAAAAALPLALALPAQAAPTDASLDSTLLLLKLEELLAAFYTQALAAGAVLSNAAQAAVRPDFERILAQQQNHARFLRTSLTTGGLTPPATPTFDFSGRKNNAGNPELFPNVMTDYNAFLQLAQQLEDASADIYLGQMATFTGDRLLLDVVLRMQSVEARHASHIRTLRRNAQSGVVVKNWPSAADTPFNSAVLVPNPAGGSAAPVSIYSFETNEKQVVTGANVVPFASLLTGSIAVQAGAYASAFDEPLPTAQATALLNLFS
ncbi:ferritin-like domain-containing protein [Hymenobacter sp. BT770]|uniref:ferritin-like domain-containing protein n=1 Tax=Hymenobacter sp. BT770 TaxID=2886942 RepID=UPI001D11D7AD|nr:ferritin-like domain-containing protein [Hymenobacter sp. BT770]MCC3151811.1 ferritin-like domain-containing protein [Hymenobacter sp. BT770]MDO3413567.1 ferritin-like domain-containing protein [Hymenobacter sp. BT770]